MRYYNLGLSPQARGKRTACIHQREQSGPIPAGTGETNILDPLNTAGRAYPRRHGGNVDKFCLWVRRSGLSPQARGKPQKTPRQALSVGPIPAGTGETSSITGTSVIFRAYPRRHGGNSVTPHQANCQKGLSPQARGKLDPAWVGTFIPGPIPAGTGETSRSLPYQMRSGAYPRRHGGNPLTPVLGNCLQGLSPQARGKRTSYG